jgi:hypothetical protein
MVDATAITVQDCRQRGGKTDNLSQTTSPWKQLADNAHTEQLLLVASNFSKHITIPCQHSHQTQQHCTPKASVAASFWLVCGC